MRLHFPGDPQALARPRLGKWGNTYNSQKEAMDADKWWVQHQIAAQNSIKLAGEPIVASVVLTHPIPSSWSQKRRNEAVGASYMGKKDIDNCLKYYFDVMNTVAYQDDKQIASVWADQVYGDEPGVDIQLHSLGGEVIKEHAVTTTWSITQADIELMVKKANKIGLNGRLVNKLRAEDYEDGIHYYFEIEAPRNFLQGPRC